VTATKSTPSRVPWPPILYLAAIAVAAALNVLYPLPWIGQPLSGLLFAIGWVVLVLAVALFVSAVRTLRRAATTVMPHRASEHLVTGGPFSFTRNPIYLADTMIVIAIGLIIGSVWFPVFALLAAAATTHLAIRGEERHLFERFGKRYRDYTTRVRRWI
jgi:protein-S-isoprenylcysteine O-methyltransferase Ste14